MQPARGNAVRACCLREQKLPLQHTTPLASFGQQIGQVANANQYRALLNFRLILGANPQNTVSELRLLCRDNSTQSRSLLSSMQHECEVSMPCLILN